MLLLLQVMFNHTIDLDGEMWVSFQEVEHAILTRGDFMVNFRSMLTWLAGMQQAKRMSRKCIDTKYYTLYHACMTICHYNL